MFRLPHHAAPWLVSGICVIVALAAAVLPRRTAGPAMREIVVFEENNDHRVRQMVAIVSRRNLRDRNCATKTFVGPSMMFSTPLQR